MSATLDDLLAASPFLAGLNQRFSGWLETALWQPDDALADVFAALSQAAAGDEAEVAVALREAKGRVALLAAAAEVTGRWTTAQSTAALSDLADRALDAGLAVLLRRAAEKGEMVAGHAEPASCGLMLFALGKHGGRELNYSSDIDIVAFFDASAGAVAETAEPGKVYTRIVQRLAAMMQDRTADGYVFRTDLRLRPDPGSTPVALSVDAALAYYESRGQNWERAAWIKARPAAGDKRAGEAFLRELGPYVWRRHLDFATIADIQAMKRQINVVKNVGHARVEGHNVKLGQGGIREIEFFTQTQQLIAGGRQPSLRVRPTAEALAALAASGWITPRAADELIGAYWFLRAVENRLQMLRDEQTHVMPDDAAGISVIAQLMGMAPAAFRERYLATLALVGEHYGRLFIEGETLSAGEGDLVFTGSDDDPSTLETLSALGFSDPRTASATVRKWHYGGYLATRAAAARAHLTELLPLLLRDIGAAGNADETLVRFDRFLSRLPSGVQLFSLLRTHERLRKLMISLLGSAPRMADSVMHRVHVMDGLIDPAFADEVSRPTVLVEKVAHFLAEARSYEDVIDRARIIGGEQKFLIAAGLLSGTISGERAGRQFTALAETLLDQLFAAVRREFEARHGRVIGAKAAVLAFGKMASREMTATSDLDIILLYDSDGAAQMSDGPRPLATSHYFTRLTQRLVAAVTAPTAEGVLYQADMRLRPSGNAGPLATSLPGFINYQQENAWTWEHLALTRARVVIADEGLAERVANAIEAVLAAPVDHNKIIDDVVSMRALMARERPPRHPFDLKLATGGLVDLEFIAQSAQLVSRQNLALPHGSTADVLARMGAVGLLPEAERLVEIHGLFSTVLQIMSAALVQPLREEDWNEAFRELLAGLTNYPSFTRLKDDIAAMEREVSAAAAAWYERARAL